MVYGSLFGEVFGSCRPLNLWPTNNTWKHIFPPVRRWQQRPDSLVSSNSSTHFTLCYEHTSSGDNGFKLINVLYLHTHAENGSLFQEARSLSIVSDDSLLSLDFTEFALLKIFFYLNKPILSLCQRHDIPRCPHTLKTWQYKHAWNRGKKHTEIKP